MDKDFNEGMFKSYVGNIFVQIYTAFMLDELPKVRHFMSESLYLEYQKKLDDLNSKNLRQMYEQLNVKSTTILNFEETEKFYVVKVLLTSRFLDYLIQKDTGDFVRGDMECRVEKNYVMTFQKKKDSFVQSAARKCPGCGASISVNQSGFCEYCGTSYNLSDYDYILVDVSCS